MACSKTTMLAYVRRVSWSASLVVSVVVVVAQLTLTRGLLVDGRSHTPPQDIFISL